MNDNKLIFLHQNTNQKINFLELSYYLVRNKYVESKNISFISIDNAFYDREQELIHKYHEIKIDWVGEKSIYRLGLLKRLFNLFLNIKNLKKLSMVKNNIFIVGNDGAIQRYINNYFSPDRFYIICDTVIGPQKKYYIYYKIFYSLICTLRLSHFFPGLTFHTPCDGIFLSHKNSKNLLVSRNVTSPIHVVDMPLHKKNRIDFYEKKKLSVKSNNKLNVIYITSAFAWHRKYIEDSYQKQDLQDLIKFFDKNSKFQLRIRIHPREELKQYAEFKESYPNIRISYNTPLVDDLVWCDKLITAASSVASEADILGIDTYIYRKNFGKLPKESLYFNGYNIINSFDEIDNNFKKDNISNIQKDINFIAEQILVD